MRKRKNYIPACFLLLSITNIVLFFYRDHFIYHRSGTYSSLYSSDTRKWKQFVYDYPKADLRRAKKILDSSIQLKGKTSAEQVIDIGRWLYDHFNKRSGKPSDTLLSSSPLRQYQLLNSSVNEKIWCGVYANMFAFFCWSEGIPCRIIEIMNAGDHHVFNECFLAEAGQWAMVDLTFNRLLIKNESTNRYLNFFDMLHPVKDSMRVVQSLKDTIIAVGFEPSFYSYYLKTNPPVYYYYRINNFEVYKPLEKIKRYLLPVAWYEEVNSSNSNLLFYVKELSLLLWFITTVVLLFQIRKR